jgi:hypothetical protein
MPEKEIVMMRTRYIRNNCKRTVRGVCVGWTLDFGPLGVWTKNGHISLVF